MYWSMPDFPVLHHLLEFAQTHVCWVGDAIQPSHPLLSSSLPPSIIPSIRVFSNESVLHIRWPKFWSFIFSISPSNKHSGLISFRTDWFDLLGVQGTLKSSLQHQNLKASILWCSAFTMLQLSHSYMTTGKTITLTIQTFVSKMMSLLFNVLSRFVITFLLRSKHLLISWLQSLSAVILEPKKTVCRWWITSWNQDFWEKYQQPQICRWYQPNGRKWRGTKEPFDEGERKEWKSWLKTTFKKLRSWHLVPSIHGK